MTDKRYHIFKSWKVYIAYVWWIAEQIDRIGARTELVSDTGVYTTHYTQYAQMYKQLYGDKQQT